MSTRRVFVTGTTGLVGSNVVKVAAEKYGAEVVGTIHRTKPTKSLPFITETLDIRDKQGVFESIKKYSPDVVIHSAAIVDLAVLEKNHKMGWEVMVEATENIARICQETKTKLIFISTDYVFDGLNPPYRENSIPCPINYYGVLKVAGEITVRLICEDYAIARIAGVEGVNMAIPTFVPPERDCGFGALSYHYLKKFQAGAKITEWNDYVSVKSNPTLVSNAADAIMAIYARDQKGIFHCCGNECITRIDLARKVAKVFGFDEGLISTSFHSEADLIEWNPTGLRWPKEPCLDTTESQRKLGRKNLGVEEMLIQYKKEIEEVIRSGGEV